MALSKDNPEKVDRIQQTPFTKAERRLLDWLCERMPAWVTPDKLTLLAALAAIGIGLCFAFSGQHPWLLWLSIALFGVHWFGDSLDGSIARYRRMERPNYGFFIDHSSDMMAGFVILGGLGLSPYVRIEIALLALAGYFLLAIHTFLLAKVTGEFHLSHGGLGPTEIRMIFIALTLGIIFGGPDVPSWGGYSVYDIVVGGCAVLMLGIFAVVTLSVGRRLSQEDNARLAARMAARAEQDARQDAGQPRR
ncbi:CDP-alcohol phosphatidyltransferase family protein [Paraurantiacibacter namhicola]|uniref:CDP-alcohol phosphatidyltransferase n=1 Tax=Paraurantiacibacter namhicola TaxID=645517 RepID=A0A1C7D9X6_9SPHN|nr:CDP-alcohol phosphatidyltransferase family protein [Paraurantiacibacter namhicola]ANU08290.1 CDP-alcohol phosphatidyltransferase [Paraurantiacibacter namhicola]